MKVPKYWWKNFFNDVYLLTDARSVCNRNLTKREVNLVEKTLKPKKSDKILDLCGGYGRHSMELAKRGYSDLTVLDFSGYLIGLGKKLSKEKGLKIKFRKDDARSSSLKAGLFSYVLIMANSFGYSASECENLKMLKESNRLLKKGGKILLDLSDAEEIRKKLKPVSWHEASKDVMVLRERELKGNTVRAREVVVSKKNGLLRDGYYCERLYSKERIKRLLSAAGFQSPSVWQNISMHDDKKDYGLMTSRMFVMAVKT